MGRVYRDGPTDAGERVVHGDSVLVRHGKGGRRREVGMDRWGWDQLNPWLELRVAMPVGPLLCVLDGPTCRRPWAADAARA
jgi:hypothetical protein